ncbi:hypothetical protein AMECASPLE_016937 [Ameca splendens]|uniref:YTH domain-containing family protein n=1 Tax=Ameca splendens TaxID=208324 RepID=A0ABV0ZCV7_9TELE
MVTSITVAVFAAGTKLLSPALQEPAVQKRNENPLDDMSDSDTEDLAEIKIDDWLAFQLERETAGLVSELRQKWQNLFIKRIRCPSKPWSQQDETVIQTLVSVLGAEEQEAGLQQPTGIGQRPRPMSSVDGPRSSVRISKTSPQLPTHTTNDKPCQMPFPDLPKTTSHSRDDVSLAIKKLWDNPSSSSSSCSSALDGRPESLCPSSSRKLILKPVSQKPALSSVRYFIMKSNSIRNIEISQQKGIWSTTPSNETKLTQAFLGNSFIILIFSVQGSGHFQGYARMTSIVSQDSCQDWGFMGLGGVFNVEWIHKESLPFPCTQHILNPWNDNKRVQVSRDGQELEQQAGSQLLSLWERNSGNQLH